MKFQFSIVTLLFLINNVNTFAKEQSLPKKKSYKKIEILESSNVFLDEIDFELGGGVADVASLEKLKGFFLKDIDVSNMSERQIIEASLGWASTQWKHDGMNSAPAGSTGADVVSNSRSEGKSYRCTRLTSITIGSSSLQT